MFVNSVVAVGHGELMVRASVKPPTPETPVWPLITVTSAFFISINQGFAALPYCSLGPCACGILP